jgi:hypothetical protein
MITLGVKLGFGKGKNLFWTGVNAQPTTLASFFVYTDLLHFFKSFQIRFPTAPTEKEQVFSQGTGRGLYF